MRTWVESATPSWYKINNGPKVWFPGNLDNLETDLDQATKLVPVCELQDKWGYKTRNTLSQSCYLVQGSSRETDVSGSTVSVLTARANFLRLSFKLV